MKEPLIYPTKIYASEFSMSQVRSAYEEDIDGLTPRVVYKTPSGWVAGNVDDNPWELKDKEEE